jgi:hypothetical protein
MHALCCMCLSCELCAPVAMQANVVRVHIHTPAGEFIASLRRGLGVVMSGGEETGGRESGPGILAAINANALMIS